MNRSLYLILSNDLKEINASLLSATKTEVVTDENVALLSQTEREFHRKTWSKIILSLLSESMRPIMNPGGSLNRLSLEFAYYLADALAAIAPFLHKYVVALLPKMLLMLDRIEESYDALKAMQLQVPTKHSAKVIRSNSIAVVSKSRSISLDEPIVNVMSKTDVDIIMVLDLALTKILTANRIKEFHVFKMNPWFINHRNVLYNIGSFLGCPLKMDHSSSLVLERQAMELLKFIHQNNRTILPSIVLRSREKIIAQPAPVAVKLSFQEWYRHTDALLFLKDITDDLCKCS